MACECGCGCPCCAPIGEIERDPDELRRILEEQRDEIERQLKDLEATVEA
jgi:hypothetical protein